MGTRSNSGLDGPTIRRLRSQRNWTQRELVEQLRAAATDLGEFAPGVTVQMISRWENGKSGLGRENSRLVEHAFARTMDFNTESWEAEVDRRKFLAGSVTAGVALFGAAGLEPWQRLSSVLQHRNRLDLTAVENLETVTATFSELFQTVAPMALIAPVQSHLGTLTQLLGDRSLTGTLRRRLASLAGESSILLGWITQDHGDQAVAQQLYLSALDAAGEAGDPALGAYAIASASTLDIFRSSPTQSIYLLTDAEVKDCSVDAATPSTRAWIYTLLAEAHTRGGSGSEALDALDEAHTVLDDAEAEDEPRPRAIFFDKARLAGERGVTAVRLNLPDEAEPSLHEALETLDNDTKTESRILTHLARARLQQQEIEEACRLALRSLDVAQQTGSTMGITDIHDFRLDLNEWNGTDAVRQLDERLATPI